MKKVYPFILILLCILVFAISYASAEGWTETVQGHHERQNIPDAKLPESVTIIKDEAFEGTALIKVELPSTLTEVGEYAFANISTLREVRISLATKYIASTAFDGSKLTTITAPVDSYAKTWAKKHGIPYSPIVMFCASAQGTSILVISAKRLSDVSETRIESVVKPETQWRRVEEINITRTEELIANHVQGRSPPMA